MKSFRNNPQDKDETSDEDQEMGIDWNRHDKLLALLQQLKGDIAKKAEAAEDKQAFFRALLLYAGERYGRSREEVEALAIAMASFFEDHPELWEGSPGNPGAHPPDPAFKSWKEKVENLLDVLRKFLS